MSKKSKTRKSKHPQTSIMSQADKQLDLVSQQMVTGDYENAVITCERLLNYLPPNAPQRGDALAQLGTAHSMLQNFPQSYAALTEALTIEPEAADLWYNRGMSSRYTCRAGRSVRDFERAVELNKNPALQERFEQALKDSRELAEESLKTRGKDFTLEQLIEQEDLFQQGLTYLEAQKWEDAEQDFHASIAMGDCLPQPWGNLGTCLLMQERYDEAEAAWKQALVIDPEYTLAKTHLNNLADYRQNGPPTMFRMFEPFKNVKLKQSVTFVTQ